VPASRVATNKKLFRVPCAKGLNHSVNITPYVTPPAELSTHRNGERRFRSTQPGAWQEPHRGSGAPWAWLHCHPCEQKVTRRQDLRRQSLQGAWQQRLIALGVLCQRALPTSSGPGSELARSLCRRCRGKPVATGLARGGQWSRSRGRHLRTRARW
jgi:hypothetical protein